MERVVMEKNHRSRMHPHKFALYVTFATILMFFAALTSAYIVRQAGGNWLEFSLPNIFFYSTIVMVLSSLTLQGAYIAFKQSKVKLYQTLLGVTLLLGLIFLSMQYQGWRTLTNQGIELTTNPSSSFLYVISGLHAAHVLGGIVAILLSLVMAIKTHSTLTPFRKLRLELTTQYWHFVDFLWLYLLVFLVMQQ